MNEFVVGDTVYFAFPPWEKPDPVRKGRVVKLIGEELAIEAERIADDPRQLVKVRLEPKDCQRTPEAVVATYQERRAAMMAPGYRG